MKTCHYFRLHMKTTSSRFHIKTLFTFWDVCTWDMWKVCLQTLRNNGLCVFNQGFVAATKNLKANYTFFVKPTCFLLVQESRRSIQNFWLWLCKTSIDILQTFSTVKVIPDKYLESKRTSAITFFVIFSKKLHRR